MAVLYIIYTVYAQDEVEFPFVEICEVTVKLHTEQDRVTYEKKAIIIDYAY